MNDSFVAYAVMGNIMKEYKVLKYKNLTEFESDEETIKSLTERGYSIVDEVVAVSTADARIKYEESMRRSNEKPQDDDPSGYLNIMSTIFLITSLVGAFFMFAAGSSMADSYRSQTAMLAKYFFVGGGSLVLIGLLVHSACRCLIYITRKQAKL